MKQGVLFCAIVFSLHSAYAEEQKPDCRSYIKYHGVTQCLVSRDEAVVSDEKKKQIDQTTLTTWTPFIDASPPVEPQQEISSSLPIDLEKENVGR
jgi:hypothetical protein